MEILKNNEGFSKFKKKEHLHVPIPYIPQCKNVHPEKESFKTRLKTKSIDHSVRYLFQKKQENNLIPKINPALIERNFMDKKKTREMASSYGLFLNSKFKMKKKWKNNDEESPKQNNVLNFATETKRVSSPNAIMKNSQNVHIRSKTMSDENIQKVIKNPLEKLSAKKDQENINNEKGSLKKDEELSEDEEFSKEEKKEIKNKFIQKERVIERNGMKIYGQEKFDQGRIKKMFEFSLNQRENTKLSKKKKKKKTKKNEKVLVKNLQSVQSPNHENVVEEKINSDMISLWRFNMLTDNFEFNENEDEEMDFNVINNRNKQNHKEWKKSIALNLALSRLKFSKENFEENEKHLQRNYIFLSNLSSKQSYDYAENLHDEEVDNSIQRKEEITEFDYNYDAKQRNSLPLITQDKKFINLKTKLKSLHDTPSVKASIQMQPKVLFMRLTETIKGICKREHLEHKKILKSLKNENRLFNKNIHSLDKKFEKIQ